MNLLGILRIIRLVLFPLGLKGRSGRRRGSTLLAIDVGGWGGGTGAPGEVVGSLLQVARTERGDGSSRTSPFAATSPPSSTISVMQQRVATSGKERHRNEGRCYGVQTGDGGHCFLFRLMRNRK